MTSSYVSSLPRGGKAGVPLALLGGGGDCGDGRRGAGVAGGGRLNFFVVVDERGFVDD